MTDDDRLAEYLRHADFCDKPAIDVATEAWNAAIADRAELVKQVLEPFERLRDDLELFPVWRDVLRRTISEAEKAGERLSDKCPSYGEDGDLN